MLAAVTLLVSLLGVAVIATPVGAAKKALPDACTAVTQADITAAFVKLDAASTAGRRGLGTGAVEAIESGWVRPPCVRIALRGAQFWWVRTCW